MKDKVLTTQNWIAEEGKVRPKCSFCPNEGWVGLGIYLVCGDCLKKYNQKKADEIKRLMEE